MPHDVDYVLAKLDWMRCGRIWPNGLRYLWTDAFGVALLVSLCDELGDGRFVDEAEWVVSEVDRILGRPRGIRIGMGSTITTWQCRCSRCGAWDRCGRSIMSGPSSLHEQFILVLSSPASACNGQCSKI